MSHLYLISSWNCFYTRDSKTRYQLYRCHPTFYYFPFKLCSYFGVLLCKKRFSISFSLRLFSYTSRIKINDRKVFERKPLQHEQQRYHLLYCNISTYIATSTTQTHLLPRARVARRKAYFVYVCEELIRYLPYHLRVGKYVFLRDMLRKMVYLY